MLEESEENSSAASVGEALEQGEEAFFCCIRSVEACA
jgi:hypothetical protein